MTTDVIIQPVAAGYYDISFTGAGDLLSAQSMDTAILMSILAEKRATESEVPESQRRRGWIGNESTPGIEMGSKAWQFEQSRITGSVLSDLAVIINNGLKWMVEQDNAIKTAVQAFYRNGRVEVEVVISRSGSVVDKKLYPLWNNTGAYL